MKGVLLYSAILAICYVMTISFGKKSFNVEALTYRIMILIISIELCVMWLFATEYIVDVPFMMRVNSPLSFLLAPAFFLYIYSRLENLERFRLIDSIHLIPAVFMFIYLLPFYVMPSVEKIALYHEWRGGKTVDSIPTSLIFRIHQFLYVVGILYLIISKRTKIDKLVGFISFAFILIWVMDMVRVVFQITNFSIFVWFHFTTFLPLLIFFELRFQYVKGKKYATSGIRGSETEPIALQTYDLLRDEGLFKNPKLNLIDLAKRIGVHPNYVSQAINSSYGKKFKDLVNAMRVKEAKKLLADKSLNHLTLEAIAEMAGFNSVSSFNSSFKKIEGDTPSSYKRRVQYQNSL